MTFWGFREKERGAADDERRVRAVKPDAFAFYWMGLWRVYDGHGLGKANDLSGPRSTKALAWAWAWKRLREAE